MQSQVFPLVITTKQCREMLPAAADTKTDGGPLKRPLTFLKYKYLQTRPETS